MKTKEIDGVLYELVPKEREGSCSGCIFKDPNGSICTILTKDCNGGLIYKKVNKPISNSHLKPFNLEAAKAGKPVCTRDGRKARIICFDKKCLDEQVLIVLVGCGKEECMYFYTTDGKYIDDFSSFDLMMSSEKKEGWVNVYKHNLYDTESEAKRAHIKEGYIDTIKIEWEE